ncbi:MAG: ribonuclease HII [Patescibacteria group bacterium]|nr:ribonuclease HII [Patescibacteria group bacterium]
MIIPDFSREKQLLKKGYRNIAGLDEAGRGPLAGPVVAAAVIFNNQTAVENLLKSGVRDSKTLAFKKKEFLYKMITENCQAWSVGIVAEEIIDKINILKASLLAMRIAVERLNIEPDFLLVDGNQTIENYPADQTAIPGADQNIFSVSAASIIAKVTRDRILIDLDKKYPEYGFARHKGYGTKLHLEMLAKVGPCKIHRKSFAPIKKLISKNL